MIWRTWWQRARDMSWEICRQNKKKINLQE
jgi:hypothetical protein